MNVLGVSFGFGREFPLPLGRDLLSLEARGIFVSLEVLQYKLVPSRDHERRNFFSHLVRRLVDVGQLGPNDSLSLFNSGLMLLVFKLGVFISEPTGDQL